MKNILGWFDFAEFYDMVADRYQEGIFVELGVWKGLSIRYLAEKVKDKKIEIVGVDTFEGTKGEHDDDVDIINGTLYETYLRTISPYKISTIIGKSDESAANFPDKSVDFVFIDADHHYESVKKDIKAWLLKIKKGGLIAGHDYYPQDNNGVVIAVNEAFPDVKLFNTVWYYDL